MLLPLVHTMTPLAAALAYAAAGWAVFPLAPRRKIPLFTARHRPGDPLYGRCHGECGQVGHGFYDATTNPEKITAWWTQHPDAGIGVRTGAASGLLTVDVDPGTRGIAPSPSSRGSTPRS